MSPGGPGWARTGPDGSWPAWVHGAPRSGCHPGAVRLPTPALPLAAAVAALVLAGCSAGGSDTTTPTASSSSSASSSASATPSATSPTSSGPAPSATSLTMPEAQASALVEGLSTSGALTDEQRQQVQDRLATALADPSTQDKLQQVCTVLGTGLASDATLRSLVRRQLESSGTSLTDAQVDAVIDTLRTDVCTD